MKKEVYVFQCQQNTNLYGLTEDSTGQCLPVGHTCNAWNRHTSLFLSPDDPKLFNGLVPEEILISLNNQEYLLVKITMQVSFTETVIRGPEL